MRYATGIALGSALIGVVLAGQYAFAQGGGIAAARPDPKVFIAYYDRMICVNTSCSNNTAVCTYASAGSTCVTCSFGGINWYCIPKDHGTCYLSGGSGTCGTEVISTCAVNAAGILACVGTPGITLCTPEFCVPSP